MDDRRDRVKAELVLETVLWSLTVPHSPPGQHEVGTVDESEAGGGGGDLSAGILHILL